MAEEGAPAEGGEEEKKEDDSSKIIVHTYPLVRFSDMAEELRNEALEQIVTACEKFADNNEMAAKMVKDGLDKKFGPPWNVVIGGNYGFEITYEVKNLLYMYVGGNIGACVWKI